MPALIKVGALGKTGLRVALLVEKTRLEFERESAWVGLTPLQCAREFLHSTKPVRCQHAHNGLNGVTGTSVLYHVGMEPVGGPENVNDAVMINAWVHMHKRKYAHLAPVVENGISGLNGLLVALHAAVALRYVIGFVLVDKWERGIALEMERKNGK